MTSQLRRAVLVCGLALPAALALTACGPGSGGHEAAPSNAGSSSSSSSSPTGAATPTQSASGGSAAKGSANGHRATSNTSAGDRAAASGECRSSALRASMGGAQGAAGSAIRTIVFHNVSSHACWLRGYPGVSYVTGSSGTQVGSSARRNPSGGPSAARVWLIPGAHAHATMSQPNVGNYPASTCKPTSVRGLRVYPPGETAAIYVPDSTRACATAGVGRPSINAVSGGA